MDNYEAGRTVGQLVGFAVVAGLIIFFVIKFIKDNWNK